MNSFRSFCKKTKRKPVKRTLSKMKDIEWGEVFKDMYWKFLENAGVIEIRSAKLEVPYWIDKSQQKSLQELFRDKQYRRHHPNLVHVVEETQEQIGMSYYLLSSKETNLLRYALKIRWLKKVLGKEVVKEAQVSEHIEVMCCVEVFPLKVLSPEGLMIDVNVSSSARTRYRTHNHNVNEEVTGSIPSLREPLISVRELDTSHALFKLKRVFTFAFFEEYVNYPSNFEYYNAIITREVREYVEKRAKDLLDKVTFS